MSKKPEAIVVGEAGSPKVPDNIAAKLTDPVPADKAAKQSEKRLADAEKRRDAILDERRACAAAEMDKVKETVAKAQHSH